MEGAAVVELAAVLCMVDCLIGIDVVGEVVVVVVMTTAQSVAWRLSRETEQVGSIW